MTIYQPIAFVLVFVFGAYGSVYTQTSMNSMGFGVGTNEGDASPNGFSMLYSVSYLRMFPESPFAIELSAHITGREYIRAGGANSTISSIDAAMADATALYIVREHEHTFRFGVGVSVRHYSFMASNFTPPSRDSRIVRIIEYGSGFHGKAEYAIPIGSNLEMGLRTQAHFFLLPFSRNTTLLTEVPNAYPRRSLALGAFFRINF
jgi:hypothetical protein